MTKRKLVAGVLAATMLVGVAAGYLALRPTLPGGAIENGMDGVFLSMPVMFGDRVYAEGPTFRNVSHRPITIESVSALENPEGVELVDVRVYQTKDFPDEAPPAAWSSSDESLADSDPAERPSHSVVGSTIAPGEQLASGSGKLILVEFRTVKPGIWRWPGVQVKYKQDGLVYKVGVGPTYELMIARNPVEWERFATDPREP